MKAQEKDTENEKNSSVTDILTLTVNVRKFIVYFLLLFKDATARIEPWPVQ
jgi:hypothetical protein